MKTFFWLLSAFVFLGALSVSSKADSIAKMEAVAQQAKNLQEFLKSPVLREAYYKELVNYQTREFLTCESYDSVLSQLETLNKEIPEFGKRLWAKNSDKAVPFQILAGESASDTQTSPKVEYAFQPLPRFFHRIWFELSSDCRSADHCGNFTPTTPHRWALVLERTLFYVLERAGAYTGQSVLISPIENAKKTYPLVSTTKGLGLSRTVTLENPLTGQLLETTFLTQILDYLRVRNYKNWQPFVMVEPNRRNLRSIASLSEKNKLMALSDFTVPDPIAKHLARLAPVACLKTEEQKPENVLFGKISPESGAVVSIDLIPVNSSLGNMSLPATIGTLNYTGNLGALSDLSPSQKKDVNLALKQMVESGRDPETKANALSALDLVNRKPSLSQEKENASQDDENVKNTLMKGLVAPTPIERSAAAIGLARRGILNPAVTKSLKEAMFDREAISNDQKNEASRAAIKNLPRLSNSEVRSAVDNLLADKYRLNAARNAAALRYLLNTTANPSASAQEIFKPHPNTLDENAIKNLVAEQLKNSPQQCKPGEETGIN